MPRGRLIGLLFLLLSLALSALILTDGLPVLRGPAPETSEWYWPYLLRPIERWWPALLAAVLLAAFGGWWLRREKKGDGLPIVILVTLNLALQFGLIYADRPNIGAELVDRTLSKASNGYLATAGEIDNLNEALRRFPELMPTFDNDHARTHPPGIIAAHWLTDRLLRGFSGVADVLARPATYWRCTDLWVLARPPATAASLFIWAWIPPLLGALVVIPALRLGQHWFDPASARLAALLAGTLPALLVFVPAPDQVFACLSLLSLLWLVDGLRGMKLWRVFASGLLVSLMSFLSLGNAAWGMLLGAYLLWWLYESRARWANPPEKKHLCLLPLLFAAGAALFWLVYWLGWGVAPWEIARVGLSQHYELVTSLRRYDWWLAWNIVDFFVFAGPPVVIGLIWRVGVVLRRRDERLHDDGRLALLLVALLLALNIAGSTRGEVGRLWLVFMPLAAVVAGGLYGRRLGDLRGKWLILLAQIILAVSIGLAWRSFYAVILPVERPPMSTASPTTQTDFAFAIDADRAVSLVGYQLFESVLLPGDTIDLSLFWRTDSPTLRPYTVFVQLLDESGAIVTQQDRWPVDGLWPSTCWTGDELVQDSYALTVPTELLPGSYRLVTGLYDAASGARLQLVGGGDFVNIADVLIGP